jgi:hypothetical protein
MRPPLLAFAAVLAGIAGCMPRTSRSFRVIPGQPAYRLRYPDSSETPFADVLRRYNGFEHGGGWMDLHPGIVLHIENAYYQPGASRRGLEGFLGTETAEYQVRPNGTLHLRSVRAMQDRPAGQLPVQQLVSEAQRSFHQHRFYYEILFRKAGAARGSVLLGSDQVNELNRLAAQLHADPDAVCNQTSKNCTVFPEACSVSIEMEIVVNGEARTVLWGSDIESVAESHVNFHLLRVSNGRLLPVSIDTHDSNALRLPLLPGDHLDWR